MNKLLVVYNTCSLSGQEHIPYWVNSIQSVLFQSIFNEPGVRLAISACAPGQMWCIQSENTFHDAVSYNFIEDNVPVSVTFNDTIDKCVAHFGEFENYLYLDSGINFWDPSGRYDALQIMLDAHASGPFAMTAALPSNDDGRQWLGWDFEPGKSEYVFKIGQTCNLHAQIFTNDWRTAYRRVLPDIFATHCMESIFSHMAAAIHRKFQITKRIVLFHAHSLDGASFGSRVGNPPERYPMSQMFEVGGLLFKTKKDIDERYREGVVLGAGCEENKEYWRHRPECYDAEGYAISPKLKDFYRDEFFLKQDEFDYASLRTQFVPGK